MIYSSANMTPPTETSPKRIPEDLYWTLYAADSDVGVCLLSFPIATFSGALLLGLCGSLPVLHPSGAPFWILLGICVLFIAWALIAVRTARRNFARTGMPPHEIQRRISAMWIAVAVFMLGEGIATLGYLASTFDPDRMRLITAFGTLDRPLPLVVALTLYVMAGALLLGRSWQEAQEAKVDSELHTSQHKEVGDLARNLELYAALRSGGGVIVFVFATFMLALLIASGHSSNEKPDGSRLMIIGLFAFATGLSVLWLRRSRRNFEAGGLSQEEVRHEMAAIWRLGGFLMVPIGICALAFVILAFDLLTPADRLWSLGSASVYTLMGILLLWWNRRKRGM